jgi:galactose oxidase-like protein/List-Bact-rpt repeat protein
MSPIFTPGWESGMPRKNTAHPTSCSCARPLDSSSRRDRIALRILLVALLSVTLSIPGPFIPANPVHFLLHAHSRSEQVSQLPSSGLSVRAQMCNPVGAQGIHDCPTAFSTPAQSPIRVENWLQLTPQNSPPSRFDRTGGLVYDQAQQEVVLFGVCSAWPSLPCNETWAFRQYNWSRILPISSPGTRFLPSMGYDPSSSAALLFGGSGTGGADLNDTWEFRSGTWTALNTTHAPSPRNSAALTYDAYDGYMLLFGGETYSSTQAPNGTWAFKNGDWAPINVSTEPPAGLAPSMVYDAAIQSVVLYDGCFSNDTWLYRAGTWTNVSPAVSPPYFCGTAMGYDPLSREVILFGGATQSNSQTLNQTWAFNGTTWTELQPSTAPSPRRNTWITYDAADGWNLMVSGQDNQTWIFGAGNVTFGAVPADGGQVSMGGSLHVDGTSSWLPYRAYTPSLVPAAGFHGAGLNISGNLTPYNGSYLLVGNASVRGDFQAFPEVSLLSRPPSCPIAFNGTTYPSGSSPYFVPGSFPLVAPPCYQVQFDRWSITGNGTIAIPSSNKTMVSLTGAASVTAHFSATVLFYSNPGGVGGVLLNDSRVALGTPLQFASQTYTIQSIAAPGWRFASFSVGGGIVLSGSNLVVNYSGWVYANFIEYPSLNFSASPSACGPLSFNGSSYASGASAGFSLGMYAAAAPPCPNALFTHWRATGGVLVSAPDDANTSVRLTGNGTLAAFYGAAAQVRFEVIPSQAAGWILWNGTRVFNDSTIEVRLGNFSLAAEPAMGWKFVGWHLTGGLQATSLGVTLESNGTVSALFDLAVVPPSQNGSTLWGSSWLGLTGGEWGLLIAAAVAGITGGLVIRGRKKRGSTSFFGASTLDSPVARPTTHETPLER